MMSSSVLPTPLILVMKTTLLLPMLALLPLASGATSLPMASFPASGNGLDQPVAVVVDAAGNVVITGVGHALGRATDFVTTKRGPSGAVLWTTAYNGPASSHDEPKAIAQDAEGNVYVTGSSRGAKNNDYATVKYSPQGKELWTVRYDGGHNDVATAIAVGSDGSVYVAGYSDGDGGRPDGHAIVKYSSVGAQVAVFGLGEEPGTGFDGAGPVAIKVDPTGNVLVAGAAAGLQEDFDLLVVKLDAKGGTIAESRFGGARNSQDLASALAVQPDGGFVVAGQGSAAGPTGSYLFVAGFDAAGQLSWANRHGGPADEAVRAVAVSIGAQGDVAVLGSIARGGTESLVVLKLDRQGNRVGLTDEPLGGAVAFADSNAIVPGELITATIKPGANGVGPTIATFRTPAANASGVPQILSGPVGVSPSLGDDLRLSVQVTGATGYRWFRDGVQVAGADGSVLLVPAAQRGAVGDYTVEVLNRAGSVVSAVARVSFDDKLSGAGFRADRSFGFHLEGEPGRVYEFQSSDDLTLWSTFSLVRYVDKAIEAQEASATVGARRYYRARRLL